MESKPDASQAGSIPQHNDAGNATASAEATTHKPVEVVDDVPDPDEDDLDDLDDMLDDFSSVKLDPKQPTPPSTSAQPESNTSTAAAAAATDKDGPASAAPEQAANPAAEDGFSEEDFAKQLQAGMADLLGELDKSPDMQAQFEDLLKQMSGADGAGAAADTGSGPDASSSAAADATDDAGADASFQETIRRTMERMQASGDQATAASSSGAGGEDDFMAEMLKQMSSGDFGGGEGGDEEFSKMLMGMMDQLTNKDILYEPMKELDDKFPEWLEKNKDKTPEEDLKRYEEQKTIVREIVGKFEESTYSDSNSADREFIVDRMQKMQAAGSPPTDLVGDMSSAQEAFNAPDDQCNPQ